MFAIATEYTERFNNVLQRHTSHMDLPTNNCGAMALETHGEPRKCMDIGISVSSVFSVAVFKNLDL